MRIEAPPRSAGALPLTTDSTRARAGARPGRLLLAVLLLEALDPAGAIHDLLPAGIERMAFGADVDGERAARRARGEAGAARAGDGGLFVLGMDFRLHGDLCAPQI